MHVGDPEAGEDAGVAGDERVGDGADQHDDGGDPADGQDDEGQGGGDESGARDRREEALQVPTTDQVALEGREGQPHDERTTDEQQGRAQRPAQTLGEVTAPGGGARDEEDGDADEASDRQDAAGEGEFDELAEDEFLAAATQRVRHDQPDGGDEAEDGPPALRPGDEPVLHVLGHGGVLEFHRPGPEERLHRAAGLRPVPEYRSGPAHLLLLPR